MKIYVLIETADIEIIGLRLYDNANEAWICYEQTCQENAVSMQEGTDLSREALGTLALAGDDSYAVQLIESNLMLKPF